jgi:hypothetical protein
MPSLIARSLATAALTLVALPSLEGQAIERMGVLVAPHFTQYTIGSGAAERTISQVAVPFMVTMPFTDRFSMDVTTAFASSQLKTGSTVDSEISGLTDTQVRANFQLAGDLIVITAGLNIPTGQYTVADDQAEAAGQIGNDFLNYPISSMGNGLAGTGGVAFARALGSWNVGGGVSVRKSTEFSAFRVSNAEFRFTPADEYRLNVGVDRPVGDGQLQFGLSFSAFGEDIADTTSYSTGDRLILSGAWSFPVRSTSVFLSGWNLYRLEGQQLGGDAPHENVLNLAGGVSFSAREVLIQPNLEMRLWQVGGVKAGNLINTGVRLRFGVANFGFYPSVGYSIGKLYSLQDGSSDDVTGLKGSLTIRWN